MVADVVFRGELRVREPDELEDVAEVVRDDDVPGQLRHDAHERADEEPPAVTGSRDHVHPGSLRVLELNGDGRLDLRHLSLREFRVLVPLGVVLHNHLEGFFVPVFADEVSGTLRDEAKRGVSAGKRT